jgi:IS5 family transposase
VASANVSDISQLPRLFREDDRAVFGNKGYVNHSLKRSARETGVFWGVSKKASWAHPLTRSNKRFNHRMSSIRARVEHIFRDATPVKPLVETSGLTVCRRFARLRP